MGFNTLDCRELARGVVPLYWIRLRRLATSD
jgi:hypothetical protein